jgi:hypothetical protein
MLVCQARERATLLPSEVLLRSGLILRDLWSLLVRASAIADCDALEGNVSAGPCALRDGGFTMLRKLGLDHNHALNRDLRPIVQHNVHDLRIDEYVLDQLVAQQVNHQAHECISAG